MNAYFLVRWLFFIGFVGVAASCAPANRIPTINQHQAFDKPGEIVETASARLKIVDVDPATETRGHIWVFQVNAEGARMLIKAEPKDLVGAIETATGCKATEVGFLYGESEQAGGIEYFRTGYMLDGSSDDFVTCPARQATSG